MDTYVVQGLSKGVTCEEALEALENCFGDQYLAGAYPSQLKARDQDVGESLQ
jgi:hypothetical protein